MKKLMVAIAAAAISFAGFADDTNNWFTAGFGAEASSSGGAWSPAPSSLTWDENILVLEDVDAQDPVTFGATESKASTNDENTIVFDTTVLFQGFEELPAIDTDAKAGVCALTGGDYYVVAKVEDKNAWVDTGFAADFESAVKVKVTVANGKAVYSFGANSTEPLDLVNAEFQEVCYSGNGSVSALAADTILAGVEITLPTIDGLSVTCDKVRAAVGAEVTLTFGPDTKIPSIESAKYIVGDDGTLTLKPGEDEVEALDPGAKIGTVLYLTFAEAYTNAAAGATIELCANQDLAIDIEKSITVNLAGKVMTVSDAVTIDGTENTIALTFVDSGEIKGSLVLGDTFTVNGMKATLDVSAINVASEGETGYLTGVEGTVKLDAAGGSPNSKLAIFDPEIPSLIVYVGDASYVGAPGERFVIEGEVAYATIGGTYVDSFASVQSAIDAGADEIQLFFEYGATAVPDEEISFEPSTIVYAATGEDDLVGVTLLPADQVVFDEELGGENGGWKIAGEPPVPEVKTFAIIDGDTTNSWDTIAEAIAAADAGDTITVMKNAEVTTSVEPDKALTFDLNEKTLAFNGCRGFFFDGVGGTVKNGTIVMTVPAGGTYAAIEFLDANGLVKDVVINSGNAEDGVVCWSNGEAFNGKTVVCENVDVTGSGRNFYAETAAMTLDANCSATQVGAYTGDPANSTALAAGWLGQLTVNGGAYTADANVVGTMSSPATITLNAGTYSGNFNYVPVSDAYLAKFGRDHVITKAEDVDLDAPAGYEWDDADEFGMQLLIEEVPTYAITWTAPENAVVVAIDEDGDAVKSGDEYSEGCKIAFTVTPKENYTYAGVELGTAWTLLENGAISNLVTMGAASVEVTIPEAVEDAPAWDIPGAEGGINALVKEDGVTKYVEFTSITFTATGATVGLKAAKIAAQAETFGLICKTDLTKGDTFVINASLSVAEGDPDAKNGLFTISTDLSGYDQLFVVGVGPAAVTE